MEGQFLYGYATGKIASDAYVQNHVYYELRFATRVYGLHKGPVTRSNFVANCNAVLTISDFI